MTVSKKFRPYVFVLMMIGAGHLHSGIVNSILKMTIVHLFVYKAELVRYYRLNRKPGKHRKCRS